MLDAKVRWPVIVTLAAILGFSGCASLRDRIRQQIEYIVPRDEATPGEVFQMGYILPAQIKGGYVLFSNKKHRIFRRKDLGPRTFSSFLPIPSLKPGQYRIECVFFIGKGKPPLREKMSVQILPDFREHPIDQVRGHKFKVEQYIAEQTKIQTLLARSRYNPEKLQDFILPLGGEVVSTFGTIRKYGDKAEVKLEGIEIVAVSSGVLDVNAAADGKVMLAQRLPMLGNTVLIDHGFSFASLYCHMQKLEVKQGEIVLRGGLLGKVGRTGDAAKGKRLFYQLFVAGTPIDIQNYSKIEIFE